ncbi:hypothetical protein HZH66_013669 [Vespula vulgaris]|uniref:Mos1 transposase HTH domain-containing protein n=1 Tax=Vespula vulgaris TaxID=7454 RepID=A0A834J676_VESVU|nr:hypothetical protein HZH66_013669 [Vespula vulgaris]
MLWTGDFIAKIRKYKKKCITLYFRHILLYYLRKGKNASQAHKKLCAVWNEALKEEQYQNWFAKFRSGDFSLKNAQRSGHPVKVDETHIKVIINSNCHSITREIVEELNISRTCIKKKLKQFGYVTKLD